SLNRPPTLLTMASSFSSSSMPTSRELTPDDRLHLGDRLLQHVVDYLVIILVRAGQLALGRQQPPGDGVLRLRPPQAQALAVVVQRPGPQEDGHVVAWVALPDLGRALDVDVEEDALALLPVRLDLAEQRAVVAAVDLRPLQERPGRHLALEA